MNNTMTLWVAAGGWIVTLVVCIIQTYQANKKLEIENNNQLQEINRSQDKRMAEIQNAQEKQMMEIQAAFSQSIALIDCKMESLTNEVREHNNFARRMPVIEEQIKVINHRLEDLEKQSRSGH